MALKTYLNGGKAVVDAPWPGGGQPAASTWVEDVADDPEPVPVPVLESSAETSNSEAASDAIRE
jgi:hypothetical protein